MSVITEYVKTHFMLIYLHIYGEATAQTDKSKLLGLIIDNKLGLKDHIFDRTYARGTGVLIKYCTR